MLYVSTSAPVLKNTSLGGITVTQKTSALPSRVSAANREIRKMEGRKARSWSTNHWSFRRNWCEPSRISSVVDASVYGGERREDWKQSDPGSKLPRQRGGERAGPQPLPNTKYFCRQYFLYTVVDGTAPGSAFSLWVKTLNSWGLPFTWVLASMPSGTVILRNLVYGA